MRPPPHRETVVNAPADKSKWTLRHRVQSSRGCWRCGSSNHLVRNCPNRNTGADASSRSSSSKPGWNATTTATKSLAVDGTPLSASFTVQWASYLFKGRSGRCASQGYLLLHKIAHILYPQGKPLPTLARLMHKFSGKGGDELAKTALTVSADRNTVNVPIFIQSSLSPGH